MISKCLIKFPISFCSPCKLNNHSTATLFMLFFMNQFTAKGLLYFAIYDQVVCNVISLFCSRAPKWSAARSLQAYPQFSWDHIKALPDTEPVYFTGEMVCRPMVDIGSAHSGLFYFRFSRTCLTTTATFVHSRGRLKYSPKMQTGVNCMTWINSQETMSRLQQQRERCTPFFYAFPDFKHAGTWMICEFVLVIHTWWTAQIY